MADDDDNTRARSRRPTSAVLSLLAAATTFLIFGAVFVTSSSTSRGWLLGVALPPIVVSLAAAAQYRWGTHSGAGAAAVTVFWIFVVLLNVHAGPALVPGAVLQTVAWFVSRPRHARAGSARRAAS